MDETSRIKEAYDSLAVSYDQVRFQKESLRRRDKLERDFIRKSVDPGGHVLEVGCGTGRITSVLLEIAESVTAVDISGEMLNVLQSKFGRRSNLELIEGDLSRLETLLTSRRFSTVVCLRVLPHIEDVGKALKTLTDFALPGEQVLFDLWNNQSLVGLGRKLGRRRHRIPTFHQRYDRMLQVIESAELEIKHELSLWIYPSLGGLSFDGLNHQLLKRYAYSTVFDTRKRPN